MAKTLDDYKWEQLDLENRISSQRSKNDRISQEIKRLEAAYNKMGKIKRDNADNADKVRNNIKLNKVAGDVAWRGSYKKVFNGVIKDEAVPAAKDFFNSIDEIQDEIGTALAKKRGEYETGSSILDGLNKAWNRVAGIIRNWTN